MNSYKTCLLLITMVFFVAACGTEEDIPSSSVRVLNLSAPENHTVALYQNQELVIQDVPLRVLTDYVDIAVASASDLELRASSAGQEESLFLNTGLTIGENYTLVAIDSIQQQNALLLTDTLSWADSLSYAFVRFVHVAASAPELAIIENTGDTLVEGIRFYESGGLSTSATPYLRLTADSSYQFAFHALADSSLLHTIEGANFEARTSTTLFLYTDTGGALNSLEVLQ